MDSDADRLEHSGNDDPMATFLSSPIEQRDDHDLDAATGTLRFLSDRNRLRILSRLTQAESCVCDLIDDLGLPQPLVSYHLGKLRRAGLVRARRDAQWVYYSLDPDAWDALLEPVRSLLHTGPLPPDAAWGAGRRCPPVAETS